jgi:hypothetical protein
MRSSQSLQSGTTNQPADAAETIEIILSKCRRAHEPLS